jgi:hypothetical protein
LDEVEFGFDEPAELAAGEGVEDYFEGMQFDVFQAAGEVSRFDERPLGADPLFDLTEKGEESALGKVIVDQNRNGEGALYAAAVEDCLAVEAEDGIGLAGALPLAPLESLMSSGNRETGMLDRHV